VLGQHFLMMLCFSMFTRTNPFENNRVHYGMQVLERGTRSIAVMFRAIVFTFIPTAIELVRQSTWWQQSDASQI
jgi:ABC-type transport system involved in Fe-S cluster assembly fused permease/ATPase subunit